MERIIQLLRQYRYGVLVLVIGIFLMLLPTGETDIAEQVHIDNSVSVSVQDSLEEILGQIEGAGKVRVMLTQSAGELTIYQQNTDISADTTREDTVVITDAEREERGLVQQVIPPVYLGAIIVCQGGDRAAVKLAIVEAVASVTGLTSDKITVLKMK